LAGELNRNDETLDDLLLGDMKLIQARRGYRFSLDAVLLAHFPDLSGVSHGVDLGTGSGIIPLLLAFRSPFIRITGIEIQESLAERAHRNVALNGLQDRITIIKGDIKEIHQFLSAESCDLVISNPPFYKINEGHISENEEQSIARHELQIKLAELIEKAGYLLQKGGRLALIHRVERMMEIFELIKKPLFVPKKIRMIHSRIDEPARLFLLEVQKQGRGQLSVLPPLIIYNQNNEYSPELQAYYKNS